MLIFTYILDLSVGCANTRINFFNFNLIILEMSGYHFSFSISIFRNINCGYLVKTVSFSMKPAKCCVLETIVVKWKLTSKPSAIA